MCACKQIVLPINDFIYFSADSSEDETTVVKKEKKQDDNNPMIQSVSILRYDNST